MPTLQFKGKTFVQNHHLAVKYHQLVPNKKLSLTDKISLHDNLIIQGDNLKALKALLPTYTATGEEFNEKKINEKTGFIRETKNCEVYMFYKPDVEWLKRNAHTLDAVKAMPKFKGKQRLVFAPAKYVDDYTCLENRIDFCQLPYEIYRIQ